MDLPLRPVRRQDVSGLTGLLGHLGYPTTEVTSSRYRTRTHEFYRQLGYADVCATSARFVKTLAG